MEHFLRDKTLPRYLHLMIKILLFMFAIFPKQYKSFGLLYYGVAMTSMGVGTLGSLITLCMASQSHVKMEIFGTIIPQMADVFIFMYFSHNEKQLLNGIQLLTSLSSDNVLRRTERFLKARLVKYIILHTAWASLFILSTVFYLLSGGEFSYKYSLMIPFWLSCDVVDDKRFCKKVDSDLDLWLSNALTMISVGVEYSMYCVALILYSVFMANIWVHLETIKASIREFADQMKSQSRIKLLVSGRGVAEYDNSVIEELYDNIKYQQKIREYCTEIIDLMRGYVSIFLAEFWGGVVFLGFTSIIEANSDRFILTKTMIISVSGAIGFVIHCMYAQVIADSNEMILHELSDIPWYEQSIKFRKIYLLCLTHNRKSIKVTASGMFTFNYEFSMTCLKTMYSFLNMMLLHYNRKGSI